MCERLISRRILSFVIRNSALTFSSTPTKPKKFQFIMLKGLDGKIIGRVTKEQAEAIARKDKLMLKRKNHEEPGTKDPHYVLYDPRSDFESKPDRESDSEIVEVSKTKSKPSSGVREKKKIQIGASIGDHDIETKARQIAKFLKANSEVQIIVFGHVKNERLEEIYKQFEKMFQGLRLVQKVLKPSALKFTILPDPEKFNGILSQDKNRLMDDSVEEIDPETLIDEKELEQLVEQELKKTKK